MTRNQMTRDQQKVYDLFTKDPPVTSHSALAEAYRRGRNGESPISPSTSLGYAGWQAGKDFHISA